jgi:hypothetical protein
MQRVNGSFRESTPAPPQLSHTARLASHGLFRSIFETGAQMGSMPKRVRGRRYARTASVPLTLLQRGQRIGRSHLTGY